MHNVIERFKESEWTKIQNFKCLTRHCIHYLKLLQEERKNLIFHQYFLSLRKPFLI